MNSLLRAFAQIASSSSSSPIPRNRALLNPILVILNSSSLFSTATTTTRGRKTLKQPQKSPPPPPTLSPAPPPPPPQPLPEKDGGGSEWRRPSEIPWQAKVANSVNLIGRVHMPVQFQASPDGKSWAGTVITQDGDPSSTFPPFWIPIIFEGDLAHIAACHLKENDRVYIGGQLSADPPPFTANQGQANVQVMVRSINFVEGYQIKKSFAPQKQEWTYRSVKVEDDIYVNQSWRDLLSKPHEWWDIRLKEGDPATFERKDNGKLLKIDESTPKWIQEKLESITFDHKPVLKGEKRTQFAVSTKSDGDTGSSWRDILDNPKQWQDYRERKHCGLVNPKHPDFKHKDGGVSLWLNSAPHWFLSELENSQSDVQINKSKQNEQSEYREINKSKPKEQSVYREINKSKQKKDQRDEFWKDLVENPNKWWDNRVGKTKPRAPDFKHKETGQALWLSDSPTWVLSRLPPVKAKQNMAAGKMDTLLS